MTCPICNAPHDHRFRPFCSRRCADIDLGRWFNEAYRIPAEDAEDAADLPDDPPPSDGGSARLN